MKTLPLVLLCCLILSACDLDLFHKGERRVAGIYELSKSEAGRYYLLRQQDAGESGTGVVDGTVMQIGWNNKFILVERQASFGGDKDGWMIVNVSNGTIVGPFTHEELKAHSEVADIHPHPPDEAWNMLR
ncbi:MAG TPA: hypothetical protein VHX14_15505 [Thermoanaerobaculia bacterium]|jgi:hypothetical protein|nr:hypothetical protein [Thermoanaerobaculia bacterium]